MQFKYVFQVKSGDHIGISDSINESWDDLLKCSTDSSNNVSYHKRLIGFTSDGANLNKGCLNSVKTVLRELSPWLVFIWCIAHRLELSLSDALKDTEFKEVDTMLLQLYLLYRKAPKKFRQLKELHDIYKETLEFEGGGIKPKKQMEVGGFHTNQQH